MKSIFLSLALCLSLTAAAQNSDKKGSKAPKQMTPEQVTNQMATQLNLSEDQKTKVLALNNQYKDIVGRGPGMGGPRPPKGGQKADNQNQQAGQQQGSRPELPQMSDSQKQQMKQHMQQRKAYEKQLKQILTDDQYKKYQQSQPGPGGSGGRQRK